MCCSGLSVDNPSLNHRIFSSTLYPQTRLPRALPDVRISEKLEMAAINRKLFIWLRPCQHDNGYLDGRSQIKVHTDERTQVHSAQSSLAVTHPGTNRARRSLTSVTESPSRHWSPLRTSLTGSRYDIMYIIVSMHDSNETTTGRARSLDYRCVDSWGMKDDAY